MENIKITIIGGGNIGSAIAYGLIKSGIIKKDQITITGRNLNLLNQRFGNTFTTSIDNKSAIKKSKYIIVSVKPNGMYKVLEEIKDHIEDEQIILSVVSDITILSIREKLKSKNAIFRIMPNTAISLNESITCICSDKKVNTNLLDEIITIFNALGKTIVIPEYLMGAATVLGACGIAYALRFLRATIQGGIQIGFNAKTSQFIAAQTLKGAAELILETNNHPEFEIDRVTTPMGVTIEGLNEMEFSGFSSSVIKGILASHKRVKG